MRISYSSSNTLQGCERKFWHEKVNKTDHDPDYKDDSTALRLGKAFHQVLEEVGHTKAKLKKSVFAGAFLDNEIDTETERGYIYAMVHKYLALHEKSRLSAEYVEVEIGIPEKYIGFVDAIMIDQNGHWWIVDLKTAGRLSNSLLSRLSRDPQLNLYSYFAPQIADKCGLDLGSFMGTRYRVTTKPTIKLNKKESFTEFVKRCYERIESYDIGIPASHLNPKASFDHIMSLRDRANKLEETPEEEVPQNFTYCETYFKPCPYWSNCYGCTFSDAAEQYTISDSSDISDLTIDIEDDDLAFL